MFILASVFESHKNGAAVAVAVTVGQKGKMLCLHELMGKC